ncbi:sensor histidine kinase [Amycolatopsis rhizosphaerae]|uniref:histidine kinase n=1 Tax=Amycolatopsis rhizosphaerae TaxID=2053003 RepID=A0A558AQC4_9PSEU|nr:histidine kinase [Amycolatopsis rhizosphaerae]TVT26436.1 sensor histidine kinase [Amycolatopsis rhizosphaerae]
MSRLRLPANLPPFVMDAAVVLGCLLVFWRPSGPAATTSPVLRLGLGCVLVAGVLVRSRWPLAAFTLTAAATFAGLLLGVTTDPFVAAAWTLYPLAVRHGGGFSPAVLTAVLGTLLFALTFLGSPRLAPVLRFALLILLVLAGTWRLGAAVRRAREEAGRAARAERDRALLAERLRLAREVHDVVSHSLSTIAVTAGVAAVTASGDAGRMRDRLADIERVSRAALGDLRGVLSTVREPVEPAEPAETGGHRPAPGLRDLPELVERACEAGTPVRLDVANPEVVPAGLGLAVYRIVREGLVNIARHAPGARSVVTVGGGGGRVEVEVVNEAVSEGTPPRSGEPGYGLLGLRERVESLGGRFTAGPRPGGGFRLHAVIPVPEEAR